MQTILVTGGAGYIGSHTCVQLLKAGYDVVIVDNLSNSKIKAVRCIQEIADKKVIFHQEDIRNEMKLKQIFQQHEIDAVIHFAGYKAVGESVEKPLEYYHNNVYGTIILCKVMAECGVKNIIFSSSATVYGLNENVPFVEDYPTSATNPYGRTKLFIEKILADLKVADPEWDVSLLRYFNPVGAHPSGLIGEDPNGIPNNLMPFISQVAVGRLKELKIFGNNYPTPDGTGVRDYIHVMDLAEGHVKAIEGPKSQSAPAIYNLGTGRGNSVLEVVQAFERVNHIKIPYKVVERRAGDIASSYADVTKAREKLKWEAKFTLEDMVKDSWNWQNKNPNGYA